MSAGAGGSASSDEKKEAEAIRELAARIYVELIARGTHVSEGSVKMDTAPENMVKLSYRFAETFQLVGAELVAAKKPATNFKLADSNIEEWMK